MCAPKGGIRQKQSPDRGIINKWTMVFTPVKRGIVPYKLFAAFTATGKVFHGRVKPHMVASGYKNKSRAHNVRPLTIRLEHQKFTAFPLPRRRCGRG